MGCGGVAGATVRWAIATAADGADTFPWWTLLANVAGCFGLGLLLGAGDAVRFGLGTGFCGGLTTFSTFAVEVADRLDGGDASVGLGYLTASVVLGLLAVHVGWRLAPSP